MILSSFDLTGMVRSATSKRPTSFASFVTPAPYLPASCSYVLARSPRPVSNQWALSSRPLRLVTAAASSQA